MTAFDISVLSALSAIVLFAIVYVYSKHFRAPMDKRIIAGSMSTKARHRASIRIAENILSYAPGIDRGWVQRCIFHAYPVLTHRAHP